MTELAASSSAATLTATHALGRLQLRLAGDDRIAPALLREFAPCAGGEGPPHLDIRFGEAFPELANATRLDPVVVGENAFTSSWSRLRYHVARDEDRYIVRIRSTHSPREYMPAWLQRLLNWNYLTSPENQAKNFMYAVFDYLSQAAQLRLGQSYVHASAFCRDERAVAVVAWGGVGKTTAMLKLVTEDSWRFLSDDLAVIDSDGLLHRSPKHLQVYAYNTVGQEELERKILGGPLDRCHWGVRRRLFGANKVRRRVAADQMFATAERAQLTDVFFLERADADAFSAEPLSVADLADRATATLLHELEPFHVVSSALHTAGSDLLPTAAELLEGSRVVLERAFARARPVHVRVPRGATPDDLAAFLRGQIQ